MRAFLLLGLFVLLSGCALTVKAGRYTPRVETIQALKDGTFHALKLGVFRASTPDLDRVRLATSHALESPTGTFARYLEEALRQELEEAGLLSATADHELSAVLLRNHVNAGLLFAPFTATGTADLEALFTLRRAGTVVYEHTKTAHHEWDFQRVWWPGGAQLSTAIPAAVQAYPAAVQKLVGALITDPEFLNAIRK